MDEQSNKAFQELSQMQSNIASLFQDILNERDQYKLYSNNLNWDFEKVSTDFKELTKENEKLKEVNEELKNIVSSCLNLFGIVNFSSIQLPESYKPSIDSIKKNFVQTSKKMETLLEKEIKKDEISGGECQKKTEVKRIRLDENAIKKEIESIKVLNFATQFDDEGYLTTNNELNRSKSESILEKLFMKPKENQSEIMKKLNEPLLVGETEAVSQILNNANFGETIQDFTQETPKKKNNIVCGSPVFKDFGNRRQDNSVEGGVNNSKSNSLKLLNEKFLLKSVDLIVSPVKRSQVNSSPKRGISTPNRTRARLNVNSPKKSPNRQLKKSNSREAEISMSGVRKLTQTVLNVECFTKKSPEKREIEEEIENIEKLDENGVIVTKLEVDEDDVILESPKKSEQVLEDIKNTKASGLEGGDCLILTPPNAPGVDLDETFVSSSVVRKCKLTEKHVLEKIIEDQTPVKRPAREKSPEYDFVPFKYKRDPVRKKAERMKLPGHACFECNKYYKEAFGGDMNSQDLRKILNKCSRHRDNNSPTSDDTPIGYWKPYLTCTEISPSKDNAGIR